jgi:hypothetical protein
MIKSQSVPPARACVLNPAEGFSSGRLWWRRQCAKSSFSLKRTAFLVHVGLSFLSLVHESHGWIRFCWIVSSISIANYSRLPVDLMRNLVLETRVLIYSRSTPIHTSKIYFKTLHTDPKKYHLSPSFSALTGWTPETILLTRYVDRPFVYPHSLTWLIFRVILWFFLVKITEVNALGIVSLLASLKVKLV